MSNPTTKQLLERDKQLEARKADLVSPNRAVRHNLKSEIRTHVQDLETKAATLTGKATITRLGKLTEAWHQALADTIYVLRKGGPTLLDLRVASNEIRILVNGPGMLFAHLKLLSSLDLTDGYSVYSLDAFKDEIEVISHCGHVGTVKVTLERIATRNGAYLQIGFGAMSMYMSELVIETKTGETFIDLIERTLAQSHRGPYLVAFEAVPGTGHHEGPAHSPHAQGFHLQEVEP